MAYFNTCRHCGAHLDPGEKCGCMKKHRGKWYRTATKF